MVPQFLVPLPSDGRSYFEYFLEILALNILIIRFTNSADTELRFTWSMRLVVAGWCLAGIVFVNSYTSSVVSYLMAPKFLPLINTVQDLADSHVLSVAIRKFSVESMVFVSRLSNYELDGKYQFDFGSKQHGGGGEGCRTQAPNVIRVLRQRAQIIFLRHNPHEKLNLSVTTCDA